MKLYSVLIALSTLFFNSSFSQLTETVLDSGGDQSNKIPVDSYYSFSYTQNIYLASEFATDVQGRPNAITKISFLNNTGNVDNTNDWTVLIGQTSKTNFAYGNDWVPFSDLETVYEGTVTANGAGDWMEIELTSMFVWDGLSNIVVVVRDQASGWNGGQINWGSYAVAEERSMMISSDYNVPNIENPSSSTNRYTSVPKIKFSHLVFSDCEDETFTGPYSAVFDQTTVCDNETFKGSFEDLYYVNGLNYQWQKLENGNWVDFVDGTSVVYEGSLTETTDVRVKMSCATSGQDVFTEPQTITVENAPDLNVSFEDVAFCDGNPVAIIASGADSYTWSPSNGLSSSSTPVVSASPSEITTYNVKGSSANGCSTVKSVKVTPLNKVNPKLVYNSSDLCSAPTTITFEVTNLPQLIGSSLWEFMFLNEENDTLADWNTTNSFSLNAPIDSVYKIKYKLRSTDCPTDELESLLTTVTVGFGAEVNVETYNCQNLGGSINVFNDFGQRQISILYENDFSDPANMANIELNGNALIDDGMAVITPSATSNSGSLVISPANQVLGSNNSMNISFDLTVDEPISNYGTGGADGISYSFADDIANFNNNLNNGRGSKLRINFDSADNDWNNKAGIYLLYGSNNSSHPSPGISQTTIAYSSNTDKWKNLGDVPVSINIENGMLTLIVAGEVIFDNVELPSSYVDEDVTNWKHSFSAATGGDANRHAISNLSITTQQYEFGLTSSPTEEPTQWQGGRKFNNLTPGTYHLWMRRDSVSECNKMVKTIELINTNPLVDLGGNYTICEGDSVVLDAGNASSVFLWNGTTNVKQTHTVFQAGVYTVQVTDTLGCTGIGSAIVNVNEAPVFGNLNVENHSNGVTVFTVEGAQNGYSYAWDFGDGNTVSNGSSNMTHIYSVQDSYTVTVVVSNDCGDTTLTSTFDVTSTVGLVDEAGKEIVSIYPNPSSDFITIDNINQGNVQIFDVNGKIVADLGEINSTVQLDISNWNRGVFFVHYTNASFNKVIKLIIQ
ncbi:MAG TPA: T9SS type A sorting domain-containing protein [Brumimicrobium sp.]|nr:T9SS type A sorting domain-containing protein [Brumimicrobium sp.]